MSLEINAGEVHGLMGDNGAGKSTLLKICSGAVPADEGTITVDGQRVNLSSPRDALELGIETVYQELSLADHRSCVANVYAGREIVRPGPLGWFGLLDRRKMVEVTIREFASMSFRIPDVTQPVNALSGGQRQGVAIARAAIWGRRVLLLDEPTASLGVEQREAVWGLIDTLRGAGFAVLIISHDVPDVLRIADRITVLRLGTRVGTWRADELDTASVVDAIVGGETR